MRIFVKANIRESMHVPGRAKQIFRENQRAPAKFKNYTFLVEKKQCKQILLQYLQKSQPHYSRKQQQCWGQTALSNTVTVSTHTQN